jgi:hypothetical protein
VLAREAARERPKLVERVVTFGTPVVGGPKYTAVAPRYQRQGYDLDAIAAAAAARDAVPLRVPVTAIYSRADGVVAWRACIDPTNRGVEHIEVGGTHVGLGFNPDVYRIVAERLAIPPLKKGVRGDFRTDPRHSCAPLATKIVLKIPPAPLFQRGGSVAAPNSRMRSMNSGPRSCSLRSPTP